MRCKKGVTTAPFALVYRLESPVRTATTSSYGGIDMRGYVASRNLNKTPLTQAIAGAFQGLEYFAI